MPKEPNIDNLAHQVRQIYKADPDQAQINIEAHLSQALTQVDPDARGMILDQLIDHMATPPVTAPGGAEIDEELLSRIFSFLLGKKVSPADLSSAELLNRLASSLNTIFDALNQLVSVINRAFIGENDGMATIRQVIGFHLEGDSQTRSLESYLAQISQAFLTAQEAFKCAAKQKTQEMLNELDPANISEQAGSGLKFGPLRKSQQFEIYEEKFNAIQRWFESDRFAEDFLRAFENYSQKLFSQQREG